ncbi:hydroxymethylpyrimidine/phosphomethylpyrimidine kinase [Fontibacillus phaseoli]|uniref:Hydroxymethylpyrimidine/phosphomethylpyrimidine kinase n=1 Tax=Fontibacillus phaseoli TaxID=1416533 RepID=A0A369BJC0_9BACL|nr:bifunctional hydroxymethylpyrimidine kinase/phosphomethylpyrimidine kinase [Fontibacillus phaseoli]RCX20688.1 hydroxymethylpyrimidine/phosphomethylpyrimidine kinase [Fontibacillus phaseoli]
MTGLRISKALTIAGSDSGGGAGIQADLKTFQELDVYGMSAITAVTVQNTLGVSGVYPLPPEAAAEQIRSVGSDLGVDAVKTGMLFDAGIIRAVSAEIRKFGWERVVVDPVMIAKGGAELLRQEAVLALKEELLPLALVVTPNIPEAEVLAGMAIRTMQDRREAAKIISAMGPKLVVIKGGHDGGDGGVGNVGNAVNTVNGANGEKAGNDGHEGIYERGDSGNMEVVDLIYNGGNFTELSGKRIPTVHTHGTGCTFSAALTAGLAKGLPAPEAIVIARDFIQAAIEDVLALGHGHGPTNHWAYRRRMAVSAR